MQAASTLYAMITWCMSVMGVHWARSRKHLHGTPAIVMENGRLYRDVIGI